MNNKPSSVKFPIQINNNKYLNNRLVYYFIVLDDTYIIKLTIMKYN